MKEKHCPYCHNTVEENESICHSCNKDLTVQCPYCKQMIKAYDEVCPCCTTKLHKKFNPNILIILGLGLSLIWLALNFILIGFLSTHPAVLIEKDKHGDLILSISDYVSLVLEPMLITIVPYIIALVKKHKTNIAATGLIVNVICSFVFIGYFIHLYNLAK